MRIIASLLVSVVLGASCATSAPVLDTPLAQAPTVAAETTETSTPADPIPESEPGSEVAAPPSSPDPTPEPEIEATAGSDGVGDPYYPQLGNGGYDVQRYVLDLDWDPDTATLKGSATIEAIATQALSALNLDFSGMEIARITVNGADATFLRDGPELTVELPEPAATGARFDIVVAYSGQPNALPAVAGIDTGGWYIRNDVAFVVSEPSGSLTWHPVNDHPSDKALYRIEMTAPSELTVVSAGILKDTIDEGNGTTTWIYEPRDPMAPYLLPLAIGPLEIVEEESVEGVVVRNAFAAGLNGQAEMFDQTANMISVFSELFGPYPFEAYGVLVLDDSLGFALEQQTMSLFGQDFFRGGQRFDDVVAHELAHQWFGDYVTLTEWDDIWLNEGFATYAPYLYFEAADPSYDIDAEVRLLTQFDPTVLSSPLPGDPGGSDLFAASVYFRGALTLHSLRGTIGDAAFFDTLKVYVQRFGGANATTADFRSVAEEVSGQDLGAFFDEWLYQSPLPEIAALSD